MQPVLEVRARFLPKGDEKQAGDVASNPSATQRVGGESSRPVEALITIGTIFIVAVLYLFVAPPTTKGVNALFALSYFVVLLSFLLPLGISYYMTQDDLLVEQMKKAPVGLVEARDGDHTEWFVRIGGELRQPTPTPSVASPTPGPTPTPAPTPTPGPSPTPTPQLAGTERTDVATPNLLGGVAVPIWVLVLAAFGASLAMAREIPGLHRRSPGWIMPEARFPTVGSRLVGGLTLGAFGAEPLPPTEDAAKHYGESRKRVIQLYLNIVAAPFLAVAIYYLIRAVSGDALQPTFVVIAFATGLFSDFFVARIKKFIEEHTTNE